MEASISIIILSLFIGLVAVKKWNIAYYIRRRLKMERDAPLKPFDCLPCFSFWISLIITIGVIIFQHNKIPFNLEQTIQLVVPIMATFIAAYILDK